MNLARHNYQDHLPYKDKANILAEIRSFLKDLLVNSHDNN
nr:9377_t:CDS:2 [Entrophospora candida]CAG8469903.1 10581_t:CDS:2 [Entrophospora candida]